MLFLSLRLDDNGEVYAEAEGHPTDVIEAFHSVAKILLSPKGPWRITEVRGFIPESDASDLAMRILDSQMKWILKAKTKA